MRSQSAVPGRMFSGDTQTADHRIIRSTGVEGGAADASTGIRSSVLSASNDRGHARVIPSPPRQRQRQPAAKGQGEHMSQAPHQVSEGYADGHRI